MSMFSLVPSDLIDRRNEIILRIHERVQVVDMGFVLDGKPSPCHIWQGSDSGTGRGGGYGRMSLNGETAAVHRVVYTHYFGYIPAKKQIDHRCNNRACCNPAHLELVSHLRNQRLRAKRAKESKS
uniref:HNH endonuclease n=1 Tax=Pseudomonas phage Arace01 TaxID=3138526 RepID=A0AAU6VZF5_9VIRU